MLRNESGDILSELERKMQMLIENHEREKEDIEKDRQREREQFTYDAEKRLSIMKEDYER